MALILAMVSTTAFATTDDFHHEELVLLALGEFQPEWDGYQFWIDRENGVGATLFLTGSVLCVWDDVKHLYEAYLIPEKEVIKTQSQVFMRVAFLEHMAELAFGHDIIDFQDGIDWTAFNLEVLEDELNEQLGYTPLTKVELSQESGLLTIIFHETIVQKTLKVDDKANVYISYRDYQNLLNGELTRYTSQYANNWLNMSPSQIKEGEITYYKNMDIACFFDDQGSLYLTIENGETKIIREIIAFRTLADNSVMIPGNDVAQALYDSENLGTK